jgi:hypothetical protein
LSVAGSLPRLAVFVVALAPHPAVAQEAVRAEGIAALVGGTAPGPGVVVVLRSDVVLRARIALAGRTEQLPTGAIPDPLLAAALDEIVGEVLIAREADRLRAPRPSGEEIARERQRVESDAGGAQRLGELLRATSAGQAEVDAIARRRAYVSAFLRANLEGSTIVSDAEVQRAFDRGEHPFTGRALDEVREPLRAWIAQRTLERDVRRWIEVLRSRTAVRVLASWVRGNGHGGDDVGG